MYACLAVTCHLHFWQNDRDFLRATVVTRGWNGYRNKSQHRKSALEKKILPPFQQGFEPATFQSRVRCSNHWAIPAPWLYKTGVCPFNLTFQWWVCVIYTRGPERCHTTLACGHALRSGRRHWLIDFRPSSRAVGEEWVRGGGHGCGDGRGGGPGSVRWGRRGGGGERGRGMVAKSLNRYKKNRKNKTKNMKTLAAWADIYIYIYIYICVCVCFR